MNLAINFDGEDEQMVDHKHLEADAGNDQALVTMDTMLAVRMP